MVATLVDEPYLLSMDQVANLTPRQISGIYLRKRDQKGTAVPLPYAFDDGEEERQQAVRFWMAQGMSEEEAKERIYGSR
jgi:hypothetical protein